MMLSIVLGIVATAWSPSSQAAPAFDGRAAAGYAYAHAFDAPPPDPTVLVTGAMAAGGWTLPKTFDAVALARFLDEQKGVTAREIVLGSANAARGLDAVPGDVLMADWGKGGAKAPAPEFMVVQGSLGNGDFVYCRNAGPGSASMGRFLALLNSPNLASARYRLYHVVANDALHGMRENALYRDENRPGVFLHVNGGLYWAHDNPNVDAFGGWAKVNTLPGDTLFRRADPPVSGTMIRERQDVKVWLIEGRIRRYVQSDGGVKRHGGWEAVRVVPDGSIEALFPKEGRPIP